MRPLYEVSMDLQAVMAEARAYAEEHDGELSNDLSDLIDSMNLERDQKIKNVALYIKNKKAESTMISDEMKGILAPFNQRKNAIQREIDSLTAYLVRHLKPKEKIKEATFSISWRKSTKPEIPIDIYPQDVDEEYSRTKIDFDRTAINNALKQGKEVYPGIFLVSTDNIQIK